MGVTVYPPSAIEFMELALEQVIIIFIFIIVFFLFLHFIFVVVD